jgi:hypothetical protein
MRMNKVDTAYALATVDRIDKTLDDAETRLLNAINILFNKETTDDSERDGRDVG